MTMTLNRRSLYGGKPVEAIAMCVEDDFNPNAQPVNILDVINAFPKADKKYIYTLTAECTSITLPNVTGEYYVYETVNGQTQQHLYPGNATVTLTTNSTCRYVVVCGNMNGACRILNAEWLFSGLCEEITQDYTLSNSTFRRVHVSSALSTIGNYAFWRCSSISNLVIPNFITTIKNGAFWMTSLSGVLHIPASVANIYTNAFRALNNITAIYVYRSNPPVIESLSFYGMYSTPLFVYNVPLFSADSMFSQFTNIQAITE